MCSEDAFHPSLFLIAIDGIMKWHEDIESDYNSFYDFNFPIFIFYDKGILSHNSKTFPGKSVYKKKVDI